MSRSKRTLQFLKRKPIIIIAGIGLIAASILLVTGASGFSIIVEPEIGNVSNATIETDSTASGGRAVKFVQSSGTGSECTNEDESCTGQNSNGSVFRENFNGNPSKPESIMNNFGDRWYMQPTMQGTNGWDLKPEPMLAQHDGSCGKPISWGGGAWNGTTISPGYHKITTYEDSVYRCKDHVMTALNPPSAGTAAGMVTLKPNHMVDLSNATEENPAIISIDVSTLSSSKGDWWDIWVTPWEDQLIAPTEHGLHWAGPPKNGLQLTTRDASDGSTKNWAHQFYKNYTMQIPEMDFNGNNKEIAFWRAPDIRPIVTSSDTRRDIYEVRMTKQQVKIFVQSPEDGELKFVNQFNLPGGFPSDTGVVQFLSTNYEPEMHSKFGCSGDPCPKTTIPATWHWDNAVIKPAVPYTLIGTHEQMIYSRSPSNRINFKKAAPANSRMLFTANDWWNKPKLSFDNGASWQTATAVRPPNGFNEWNKIFDTLTYTIPVPEGATSALIDEHDPIAGGNANRTVLNDWSAQNFHIISKVVN